MTSDAPKQPGAVREIYNDLHVEYGQFGISDVPEGDEDWAQLELPDRIALGPGRILVRADDGILLAHVWRRYAPERPTVDAGWRLLADAEFETATGDIGLFPLVAGQAEGILTLGPPGAYGMRVVVRECACPQLTSLPGWTVPRTAVSDYAFSFYPHA